MELFQQGQFVIDESEEPKEDASAAPIDKSKIEEIVVPAPGASIDNEAEAPPIEYTGSTTNVHPWLSSMVNYAQPIKFQAFDTAERKLYPIILILFFIQIF